MAASDQELRLIARAQGFDAAAKEVDKVDAAQTKLSGEMEDAAKPVDALNEKQQTLNASNEDFVSILSRIHPALGAMADVMFKGGKIAGDLAGKEIDLTAITEKATAAFAENAGALKLLGSAGVAAIGFWALSKAINAVVAESKRLQERLDALQERRTAEQEEVIAGAKDVTTISQRRREGRFASEEQAAAEEIYAEIMRMGRIRDDRIELLKQNVAALTGIATAQQIERLTMAGVGVDPEYSPEARARRFGTADESQKTEAAFRREREAVRTERERVRQRAAAEAASRDVTIGRANLEALIEGMETLVDPEKLRKALERYEEIERIVATEEGKLWRMAKMTPTERQREAAIATEGGVSAIFGGLLATKDAELLARELHRLVAMLERQQSNELRPVTINNPRYIGADAASQRERTENGERIARNLEMMDFGF